MPISRSENMRRIRAKNTAPEIAVRRLLRQLGFSGYRLHRKDVAGKPDVAFLGRKKAIFVHGCFWHGHTCMEGRRKPKSNRGYWIPKIQSNRKRDAKNIKILRSSGWDVLVIWECEIRREDDLINRLYSLMNSGGGSE